MLVSAKEMLNKARDGDEDGIGNIHGQYPSNWRGLAFDALESINNATGTMPLVLHGGTGIPEEMIKT